MPGALADVRSEPDESEDFFLEQFEMEEDGAVWEADSSASSLANGGVFSSDESTRSAGVKTIVESEGDEISEVDSGASSEGHVDEIDEAEAKAALEAACEPAPTRGFIVVRSDKGRMRRLHFLGACFRVPGEHYKDFVCHGDILPADDLIDARCKQCFPVGRTPPIPADEVASAEESDSSSSTGSARSAARSPTPVSRGSVV